MFKNMTSRSLRRLTHSAAQTSREAGVGRANWTSSLTYEPQAKTARHKTVRVKQASVCCLRCYGWATACTSVREGDLRNEFSNFLWCPPLPVYKQSRVLRACHPILTLLVRVHNPFSLSLRRPCDQSSFGITLGQSYSGNSV